MSSISIQKRKFRDVDLLRTSCGEECHRAWTDVTVYFGFLRGNCLKVPIQGYVAPKCTCEKLRRNCIRAVECIPVRLGSTYIPSLIYPGLLPCNSTSLSLTFFLRDTCAMTLPAVLAVALLGLQAGALPDRDDPAILRRACPDYTSYASTPQ